MANWRLARWSGPAACGAAIKANGYGLGARETMGRLRQRVAATSSSPCGKRRPKHSPHLGVAPLSVLHGVREADMAFALSTRARPVLNTPEQITRWQAAKGGLCDVMIDTGMNRLGLEPNDVRPISSKASRSTR